MSAAQSTAGLSTRSAPPKDRPGRPTPARIAEILAVVSVLASYGRHLGQTLEQRAVARGFATIARFFGTVTIDTILAHLQRGLMRAIALERMLLLRAARGRDLRILAPRAASRREPPAEDVPDPGQTAGSAPPETLTPAQAAATQAAAAREAAAAEAAAAREAAAKGAGERLVRRIARNEPLTLDTMPRMEEIEAEVRSSPVGRTIAAICRDLGISPSLCDGMFWNRLFDAIRLYRGSLGSLVLDVKRREQRFEKEAWKHPGLEWPEESREGIRRVLGFFIGETSADRAAAVAAPGAPTAMAAPAARVAVAANGPPGATGPP
jgi:hypothetical protein